MLATALLAGWSGVVFAASSESAEARVSRKPASQAAAQIERQVRSYVARHAELVLSAEQVGAVVSRLADARRPGPARSGALAEREIREALRAAGAGRRAVAPGVAGADTGPGGGEVSPPLPSGASGNDSCAGAFVIALDGSDDESTVAATADGSSSCDFAEGSPDIWYRFTAPSAGVYAIDTLGSVLDTVVSLHSGCPGTEINQLTCSDYDLGSPHASVFWEAFAPSEEVFIRVASDYGDSGQIQIHVSRAGTISGTVTEEGSATGIPNVAFRLRSSAGGEFSGEISTAGDGTYETRDVPSRLTYRMATDVGSSPWLDELWNGLPCFRECSLKPGAPISVTPGGSTKGVDFSLELGGKISGSVKLQGSNDPIASASVRIYDDAGRYVEDVATLFDGTYESEQGLATGNYRVATADTLELVDELYNDIPCPNECDVVPGTPVAVSAGATTGSIDFLLAPGGQISGTVTETGSGDPLEFVYLILVDDTGRWLGQTFTESDGSYIFDLGLPTGDYYVLTDEQATYVDEVWNDHACIYCDPTTGDAIAVTLGMTTSGVDFVLAPGGHVSGEVTAASGGAPLENIDVVIYEPSGSSVDGVSTQSDGTYVSYRALPSGTYHAVTRNSQGYIDERDDGVACTGSCDPAAGTGFSVAAPSETGGIDFALDVGGGITGTILDAATGMPPADGIGLVLWDSAGGYVEDFEADADGTYSTRTGLPSGNYKVTAQGSWLVAGALYPNVPCPFTFCDVTAGGTPVPVLSPLTTPSIDFSLPRRARSADGFESSAFGGWTDGAGAAPLCAHPFCVEGVRLAASCDPCVAQIIAEDSYCGVSDWDSVCVFETYTICGVPSCEWLREEN